MLIHEYVFCSYLLFYLDTLLDINHKYYYMTVDTIFIYCKYNKHLTNNQSLIN